MTTGTLSDDLLYETAILLANHIPEGAFDSVRATLTYLAHIEDDVTPETLQTTAPCSLSQRASENVVYQLENTGILIDDSHDEETLRLVFRLARVLASQTDPPVNNFVATLPQNDPALDGSQFDYLVTQTDDLIKSATDEVVVMCPFLSSSGYRSMRGALRTARGNGASITLITNALTYGEYDGNQQFTTNLLDDDDLQPVTQCYEYAENEDDGATFHAKIIIADSERAYLGTANFSYRGFKSNLELGVILRDSTVESISTLVESVRTSPFCHSVARDGGSFVRV